MPVRKFRSVEDMPDWTWLEPGDPRLLDTLRGLHRFAEATVALRFPPGVYKHRSVEDAERLCQEWADANFARYRRQVAEARLERTAPTAPRTPPTTPGAGEPV
jgi:hypothetical protein